MKESSPRSLKILAHQNPDGVGKTIENLMVKKLQILDEKGEVNQDLVPRLTDNQLFDLYKAMVFSRETDSRMLKLQRQGRLGTFPPTTGQEATFCGAAMAMGEKDWLVSTYRENGARLMRGDSIENIMLYYNGYEEGAATPSSTRILPEQVILGSQTLHAVGIAYAMKYQKEKGTAVVAFFGDGASSEGDVAEAMNFAGVWKVPVVFICQNNGWAISTSRTKQTASQTIAQKALAYGFEGVQVDGNDPLAVYKATQEALDKAKSGGGPTLVEAVTYRLLMHTTADDPKKYRDDAEVDEWKKKDPLIRYTSYLKQKGILNSKLIEKVQNEVITEIEKAVEQLEKITAKPDSNFDYLFASEHYTHAEQRAEFLDALKEEGSDE